MLFRIQSLYLFLVAAICTAMLWVPVYIGHFHCEGGGIVQGLKLAGGRAEYSLGYSLGVGQLNTLPVIYGTLNVMVFVLTIIDIALFKNRKRQRFLSRFILLFSTLYVFFLYYTIWFGIQDSFCPVQGHITDWAFLPLLNPILSLLAGIAMSNDIEKVKSEQRLR